MMQTFSFFTHFAQVTTEKYGFNDKSIFNFLPLLL